MIDGDGGRSNRETQLCSALSLLRRFEDVNVREKASMVSTASPLREMSGNATRRGLERDANF